MVLNSLFSANLNRFFAIPLLNSDHRKWQDNDNQSTMKFHWDEIPVELFAKKEDVNISVAQHYPDYTVQRIKNVADGIYYASRIRSRDGIIGIDQNSNVTKIGIVTRKSAEPREVTVDISWIEDLIPFESPMKIKDTAEIVKITTNNLAQFSELSTTFRKFLKLSYDYDEGYAEGFESVSLSRPKNYLSELLFGIDEDAKRDPGGELELFYGTNRKRTGSNYVQEFYSGELGEFEQGTCKVSIPPGHKQGILERPRKIICWQFNENKNRHIIVSSIAPIEQEDFYRWMNKGMSSSKKNAALLFVHGYNTTFSEAAWRTGQIAYDIPFNDGVVGFFSWPSTGGTIDYGRDIERADSSIQDCANFIEAIIEKGRVQELNIVAHSMGNRVVTRALNELVKKESFRDKIRFINQIVLAAPDLDKDVFDKEILPVFRSVGNRRTLYASDKDKALKLSKAFRTGLSRIGEAGSNIYVVDGLDTVDASNVMSDGNHHSYMFETKELLTDLHILVTQGLDPVQRRLREVMKSPLKYWLFRE